MNFLNSKVKIYKYLICSIMFQKEPQMMFGMLQNAFGLELKDTAGQLGQERWLRNKLVF